MDWADLLKAFVALVVVIDPLGLAPMFLALTANAPETRRKSAQLGVLTAAIVLITSALAGPYVLALFGITIASFRVVGGILLMHLALDMLNARPSRTKRTDKEEEDALARREMAIVPLGIPLIAGPGAISNVIISFQSHTALFDRTLLVLMILISCLITYLSLRLSVTIFRRVGSTGIAVMERLMGLILGAIAVEMIVKGLRELLPGLVHGV